MRAGGVLGRQEKKEDVHGLPVQGVEVDTLAREAEGGDQVLDAVGLGVGDADVVADRRRAERLARHQELDDLALILLVELARDDQLVDELLDRLALVDSMLAMFGVWTLVFGVITAKTGAGVSPTVVEITPVKSTATLAVATGDTLVINSGALMKLFTVSNIPISTYSSFFLD